MVEIFECLPEPVDISSGMSQDRIKYGCVVRAIQSFYGAKANDQEWETRVIMAKKKMDQLRLVELGEPNLEARNRASMQIIEQDALDIMDYLNRIAQTESPLGCAIKRIGINYSTPDAEEVERKLHSGHELLVGWGVMLELTEDFSGHMAHFRYYPSAERIISVSDGNIPRVILPKAKYFIYQQKKSRIW